jgi:hypothetical protein
MPSRESMPRAYGRAGFRLPAAGHPGPVIGVGVAMLVIGVIFLFVIPWVGIVVGLVGLALAVLWLAGFGRGAFGRDSPAKRGP